MSNLEEQVKNLKKTIFTMLNYANMYVLILDEKMNIRFANNSLAIDLGFNEYTEIVGKCWLDFVLDEDRQCISTIHAMVSQGEGDWEKYQEFKNWIRGKDANIYVHWFNSHINSEFNWTFSFGIRKKPITEVTKESIRKYYHDIIEHDRTMIESMKDMIIMRTRAIDSCEPDFVERNDENGILV